MASLQTASVDAAVLIAVVVSDVARDFLSLAGVLANAESFAAQVSPTAIQDELARFKIWAGNIAAHRRGRRSLEYRLRDATHLKSEVHGLLQALSVALNDAIAIVKGEREPWDAYEFSDSDTESESPTHDPHENGLQGNTELKQLLASVQTIVTSLFRLSMAIRDPAPHSQSKSTITVDKSFFQQHDINHVQAKYPACADYLTERLGRAISGRRQYLTYREEHHQKLAKNVEKIGFEDSRTEHTSNSTEATPLPILDRKNSLNVLDEDDSVSQTSFATSVNSTIRVPPLPKEARDKEFFECPLCFMIVSIHTKAGWKKHVYRDLHPYSCTIEDCTTADRLYDSRHEWSQHELEAHRTSWQCIEGCEKTFEVQSEFEHHVQKNHNDLIPMLAAIRRTSMRSANLSEQVACALCQKKMSLRGLQKHLASHQQQLALFALPPNLDDTEEEDDEDEEGPLDIENSDEDDLSDTSDPELPAEDISIDAEPCLYFKDCVGRKYSIPWQKCNKWEDMERLIEQMFAHVDVLGPHVRDGHYDLTNSDGELILHHNWEDLDKHDRHVTMHMWPMPEAPPPPNPATDLWQEAYDNLEGDVAGQAQLESLSVASQSGVAFAVDSQTSVDYKEFPEHLTSMESKILVESHVEKLLPSESAILQKLCDIVIALDKAGNDEDLTLKRVRARAEKELSLPKDYLKTNLDWKQKSYDAVHAAVEKYCKSEGEQASAIGPTKRSVTDGEYLQFTPSHTPPDEVVWPALDPQAILIASTKSAGLNNSMLINTEKKEEERKETQQKLNDIRSGKDQQTLGEDMPQRLQEYDYQQDNARIRETITKVQADFVEKEEKTEDEKEYEQIMRNRLQESGSQKDQAEWEQYKARITRITELYSTEKRKQKEVTAIMESESNISAPEDSMQSMTDKPDLHTVPAGTQQTYIKIHKDHLDVRTLEYYDLPYEIDGNASGYYIILRELSQRETEVLFEHTRRLREGSIKLPWADAPLVPQADNEEATHLTTSKRAGKQPQTSSNENDGTELPASRSRSHSPPASTIRLTPGPYASIIPPPIPRYGSNDVVLLPTTVGGVKTKGFFNIHNTRYNNDGYFEYQLKHAATQEPYGNRDT